MIIAIIIRLIGTVSFHLNHRKEVSFIYHLTLFNLCP